VRCARVSEADGSSKNAGKEEERTVAARAIWKGIVKIGSAELPVKLYSAVEDRSVHFRLLHGKDLSPIKQQMVDPDSGDPVEKEEIRKAYPLGRTAAVILEKEDLEKIEPAPSRDIEITRFVDPAEIDHRWYERAYYLGPDGASPTYFALAEALENQGKEGVARWTMRGKRYIGSLRSEKGYLVLITLRHAEEVIDAEALPAPEGRKLDDREIAMGSQLVAALSDRFDPAAYHDEYRERVLELVATKAAGKKPKVAKFTPKPAEESLEKALAASLQGVGKRRAGGGRG
jgi:DNA end-binding protein Ku